MFSTYVRSLDFEARKRYITKLHIDSKNISDPYVSQDEWVDDMPSLEFGDIYTYLIDHTQERVLRLLSHLKHITTTIVILYMFMSQIIKAYM